MTARDAALEEIAALAERHALTLDDIGARLTRANLTPATGGRWLVHVLGYLGAVLIFGGLALFIGMQWSEMNSAARVVITYGPGLLAFILGAVTLFDARFKNASTPLFLKSAILLPIGMFTVLHEYTHGDDVQLAALVVFGICAVQFLGLFFVAHRTTLLFFGFLFWNEAVGILMTRCGVPPDTVGIALGLSILSVAWTLDRTPHRPIAPFWYGLGGIGLLWAIFDDVHKTPYDLVYFIVACVMMLVAVRMRSRTLLFVSAGALLAFLAYYTDEHFAHVVGWPILLMLLGAALVAISAVAVRLGRRIVREPASRPV